MEVLAKPAIDDGLKARIDELFSACRAAGEEPYLETDLCLNVFPGMPGVFLAQEGGALVGVATVFAPSRDEAELYAEVRPDMRRRGVFTALRSAAERELSARGVEAVLFVVDGNSSSGAAAARALGAALDHREYTMVCRPGKAGQGASAGEGRGPGVPRVRTERVGSEFLPQIVALQAEGFGESTADSENFMKAIFALPERTVYGGFEGDAMVASCSLARTAAGFGLYGLVVDKGRRGRGAGASFLRGILAIAGEAAAEVSLEVDDSNAVARRLYARLGFAETGRDDYYRLSVSTRRGSA